MTAPAPVEEADHPPAHVKPHRVSVVGIIGELLILAGALLALFVVWQLFYTDIQGERAQKALVEELDWVAPEVEDVVQGVTADTPDAPEFIPAEFQFTTEPPAVDKPDFAETWATFMVPRWGEDYVKPISEGTTRRDVLDPLGIGHYEDTQMPGERGNFAIAAHRTTYGKPFADVDLLEEGDSLVVQTEDAWFVYHVTSWEIVYPQQVEVLAPVPSQPGAEPDGHYITMTTCHPKFSAAQRWVVHGELDYWAPVGHGIPQELAEVPA